MSTTITLTRGELPTRVGLPSARGELRFGALRTRAGRTGAVRAGAVRTGAVRTGAVRTVVNQPTPQTPPNPTGETATRHFSPAGSVRADRRQSASPLETLVRFAAATEELAVARAQLALSAGGFTALTAAETSRQLLTVFAQGTSGDVLPYWKMAALIRPLARFAVPGAESGLALDLPGRLLEQEFGHAKVARFEDVDFPASLTHEPTRRFLAGTGLPEDGLHFHLDSDIPLPTLAEYCADEDTATELPEGAADLIRLGRLAGGNSMVLDGRTGTILTWNEPEATLHRLNTDLSTLAFTLWLLRRARTIDFDGEAGRVL
ncbi:SUKH-4 family immunity protein [Streptomyces sp. ME02-8801-2C]|uniref:SUKH-4 family immunity protein n=1 Tax=Streptomyces sp. ME02-8801-2C TaxID=3028680 RepID=UPI0029BBA7C3|nr:SUKH-4 family immunity protein [Streptomyces sp. ME02-8801-2C]MDX3454442.1 SUKH-4 family immunity protein [Streptomyces sp. ME02-8801-2C]